MVLISAGVIRATLVLRGLRKILAHFGQSTSRATMKTVAVARAAVVATAAVEGLLQSDQKGKDAIVAEKKKKRKRETLSVEGKRTSALREQARKRRV